MIETLTVTFQGYSLSSDAARVYRNVPKTQLSANARQPLLARKFQCNLSISPYPVLTNILKRRVVRIPVHGVRPDVVD